MPRRASFDRAAVEATLARLLPDDASTLQRWRVAFDADDWTRAQWAPAFAALAAIHLGAEFVAQGLSARQALQTATQRLGIRRESLRTWCSRWSARGVHVEHHGNARSALRLIRDVAESRQEPAA
jgi:hypothetical protein